MSIFDQIPFLLASTATTKPEVGISACLNGEAVRYDGNSQTLETTSTILSKHINLIAICPEVAAGMSVPRPAIQLRKSGDIIHAVGRDDRSLDMTAALQQVAKQSLKQLPTVLCGYIFKSKSPSCGLDSTPVFNDLGQTIGLGSGLQAAFFQQHRPWLLFRDEQQLQSPSACQRFIGQCRVLLDIQQASQTLPLDLIHSHYAPMIAAMGAQRQQQLQRYLQDQHQQGYWQIFKQGLEELEDLESTD